MVNFIMGRNIIGKVWGPDGTFLVEKNMYKGIDTLKSIMFWANISSYE